MVRGTFKLRIPNDHGAVISGPKIDDVLEAAGISLEEWNERNS
jgi:hypothetical protein